MNAYLILENGKVFKGKSFGYEKETSGELVFTTGAVGYIETLTDPAFAGQIVVQAFPLIGNYGMISADAESVKAQVAGYVVRDLCDMPFMNKPQVIGGFMEKECADILTEFFGGLS